MINAHHLNHFNFLTGRDLRAKGLNRIGNLVVPNDNYCKFEDWVMPILDKMVEEQKSEVGDTFSCFLSNLFSLSVL